MTPGRLAAAFLLLGALAGAGFLLFGSAAFALKRGPAGPAAETLRLPAVQPASGGNAAFTSHRGEPVFLSAFKGTPWIAGFVFTRCGGPCPRVIVAMAALSAEVGKDGVRFAAFTVDPDYDTPEVLARYAALYALDDRFLLLTCPREAMYRIVQEGFKLGVARAEGAEAERHLITHSQRLALMDRAGAIRGYYDALDPEAMKRLADAARALAR